MRNLFMRMQDYIRVTGYTSTLPVLISALQPEEKDRVLDIGGGTGVVTQLLTKVCSEVVVLEPESKKVDLGMKLRPRIRFAKGVGESIPLPDEYFDKVVTLLSFHHMKDQVQALTEIRRVLKSGGHLIMLELDPSKLGGKLARFFENTIQRLDCGFHEPESLTELLCERGLNAISLIVMAGRYILIAAK